MYQHRQIHVWITESDYLMLREQSVETRESVSAIVRRLVKNERQRLQELRPAPGQAPEALRSYVSGRRIDRGNDVDGGTSIEDGGWRVEDRDGTDG